MKHVLLFLIAIVTSQVCLAQPETPVINTPTENEVLAPNGATSYSIAINYVAGVTKIEYEIDTDATFADANGDKQTAVITTFNTGTFYGTYSHYFSASIPVFGKQYYLRIRIYDATNVSSGWSATRTFSTSKTPVLYAPADVTDSQVNFEVAVKYMAGVAKVEYELDTDNTFNNATGYYKTGVTTTFSTGIYNSFYGQYFTVAGASFGKLYYLRVRVYDTNNNISEWSNITAFTTVAAPTLHAPATGATGITPNFTAAIHYMRAVAGIEYELDTDNTFGNASGDKQSNVVTSFNTGNYNSIYSQYFTKGGVKFGKQYYLRVRVHSTDGEISGWSDVTTFSTLAAPVLHSPTDNSTDVTPNFTVAINQINGISKMEYELDTDSSFGDANGDRQTSIVTTFSTGTYNSVYSQYFIKGGARFGKQYYLRVRVYNANDDVSAWSDVVTFSTLAAPVLHAPGDNASGINPNFTMAIYQITGATKIEYEMDTDDTFGNLTGEKQTNVVTGFLTGTYNSIYSQYFLKGGAKFGKQYYVRVRLYNSNDDVSDWSDTKTFTTVSALKLSTPVDQATMIPTSGVSLSWADLSGESGYQVELSTSNLFATKIFSIDQSGTSSGTGTLAANTTYYWRVRAKVTVDGVDYYSAWSTRSFSTGAATDALPQSPTTVTPTDQATAQPLNVTLSWSEIAGASYMYEYATDKNFIYNLQTGTAAAGATSVEITGLANNTTYFWRVRSVLAGNGSAWSPAASFTTEPAQIPVTVTIGNTSAMYDGTSKSVTVSTSPSGVAYSLTYTSGGVAVANPRDAGVYDALVSITDPAYILNGAGSATLTINKKDITVTADQITKAYGDNDPQLTYMVTPALISGDAFSGSLMRATGESPGSYPIDQGTLTAGNNYNITFEGSNMDIVAKTLTVSGLSASNRAYDGTTDATISGTPVLNGVVGTDAVTLATGAVTATFSDKNAGSGKAVVVSGYTLSGADAGNYVLDQPVQVTADITKAPLIVTAENKVRKYGEANPALTMTYSGFVNGEDETFITEPFIATLATEASIAGDYFITLSGGSANNYALILNEGILTVEKADQLISFGAIQNITTATASIDLSATASSGLPVSFQLMAGANIAQLTGSRLIFNGGTGVITIVAHQDGNDNFNVAPDVEQSFEVTADAVMALDNDGLQEGLYIFPQSASNELHVSTESGEIIGLQLYNMSGILLKTVTRANSAGTMDVDLSNVSSGVFILQVETSEGIQMKKLTIVK